MVRKNEERDRAIWEARNAGLTYQKLGEQYRITRERCRQIYTSVNFRMAMREVYRLLDKQVDGAMIADLVNKEYGISMTPENVQSVLRARQQEKKVINLQKINCYDCQFATAMPSSNCHICKHPSRREPLLYRGKNHPHDCPLRRGL